MTGPGFATPDRSDLMRQHRDARARREAAPLDSAAYRKASEDVARIEIAIAAMEEPPHATTSPQSAEAAPTGT